MAGLTSTVVNGQARTGISHNLPSDAQLRKMFDAIPILERHEVATKTLRAGVTPIMRQAKQLIPVGNDSDRDRRLEKQRGEADWETHLRDTIKTAVRKGNAGNRGGAVGVVGPKYEPSGGGGGKKALQAGPGGKIYLIGTWKKGTRIRKLWGNDPKVLSKIKRKFRNFMLDAANFSRPEQLARMKVRLTQLMDIIWREAGRK